MRTNLCVRDDLTPETGVGLDGDDGGAGQDGAAAIHDGSVDLRRGLGRCIRGDQQENQETEQGRNTRVWQSLLANERLPKSSLKFEV